MTALLAALSLLLQDDAADVIEKMKATTVSIELKDASLQDFAKMAGDYLGRPVAVSVSARRRPPPPKTYGEEFAGPDAAETPEDLKLSGTFSNTSLRAVAKSLLKPKGLTMTVRKGIVTIVTQDEIDGQLLTQTYDVSSVVHATQDFSPASFDAFKGMRDAPSRERTDNERAAALGWTTDERLDDERYGKTREERRRNVLKEDILKGREGLFDAAPDGASVVFLTDGRMRLTHTKAGHRAVRFFLDLYTPR